MAYPAICVRVQLSMGMKARLPLLILKLDRTNDSVGLDFSLIISASGLLPMKVKQELENLHRLSCRIPMSAG